MCWSAEARKHGRKKFQCFLASIKETLFLKFFCRLPSYTNSICSLTLYMHGKKNWKFLCTPSKVIVYRNFLTDRQFVVALNYRTIASANNSNKFKLRSRYPQTMASCKAPVPNSWYFILRTKNSPLHDVYRLSQHLGTISDRNFYQNTRCTLKTRWFS